MKINQTLILMSILKRS